MFLSLVWVDLIGSVLSYVGWFHNDLLLLYRVVFGESKGVSFSYFYILP